MKTTIRIVAALVIMNLWGPVWADTDPRTRELQDRAALRSRITVFPAQFADDFGNFSVPKAEHYVHRRLTAYEAMNFAELHGRAMKVRENWAAKAARSVDIAPLYDN